jgi:hypothetical protein
MLRIVAFAGLAIAVALPASAQEVCDSLFATRMVTAKPDLYARTGVAGSSAWVPLDRLDPIPENARVEIALAATASADRDIYVLKIGEERLNGDKPASHVRLVRDYYARSCGPFRGSLFEFLFGRSGFGERVSIGEYAAYHAILSKVSDELYRFHINYRSPDESCLATDDEENIAEFLFGNAAERKGQTGEVGPLILSKLKALTDSAYAITLENDPQLRRFFVAYEGYRALEVRIVPHLIEGRACHTFALSPQQLERPIAISLNELLARNGRGKRLPESEWLIAVE